MINKRIVECKIVILNLFADTFSNFKKTGGYEL